MPFKHLAKQSKMFETEQLLRRLKTLNSIAHIIRSLKAISSIRWQRAYKQLGDIETYSATILYEFKLALNLQKKDTSEEISQTAPIGLIVISADKGLCGGFNISITRFAQQYIETLQSEGKSVKLITLGRYAQKFFKNKSTDILYSQPISQSYGISHEMSRELCEKIFQFYEEGTVSEWVIIYNKFHSFSKTDKHIEKILPPDLNLDEDISTLEYQLWIDSDIVEIQEHLFFEYFVSRFYLAINESLSAEHSARIQAMTLAEDNIKKKDAKIRLDLNIARQEEINTELLDIISGVRASAV